jgi:hypothetical protein
MFFLCSMSSPPATAFEDPTAAPMQSHLAALAELRGIGMGLARRIGAECRGDPVLAFCRISRRIRLLIFMERAIVDGRLGPRARVAAELLSADLAAEASDTDADDEIDRDDAEGGEGPEREGPEREWGERLDETREFSQWLNRPLDEVIAHIRGQFAMVERQLRPAGRVFETAGAREPPHPAGSDPRIAAPTEAERQGGVIGKPLDRPTASADHKPSAAPAPPRAPPKS